MALPVNAATMQRTRKRDRRIHRANNNNSAVVDDGIVLNIPFLSSGVPSFPSSVALSFARASTANVADFDGVSRLGLTGEMRFGGASRVRNFFTYSQYFSNAAWVKTTVAGSSYANTDAAGGSTAVKIVVDNAVSVTGSNNQGSLTGTASIPAATDTVVVSCVAKAGEAYVLRIREGAVSGRRTAFNLNDGTLSYEGGATAANFFSTITPLTDGWYRCTVRYTASATGQNWQFKGCGAGTNTTGDGTSGLYVCFAQLEDVVGAAAQTAGEYVATNVLSTPYYGAYVDGVKYSSSVRLHSQNFLSYSEDFTNAAWTGSFTDVTIAAAGVNTPEGTAAWSFATSDAVTNSSHRIGRLTAASTVRGATYTIECYVKAGTTDVCSLRLVDSAFAEGTRINVSSLAAMTSTKSDTGSPVSPAVSITDAGGGWRKLTVTCTFSNNAAETGTVYWVLYGGSSTVPYVGDTTTEFVFARPAIRRVSPAINAAYVTTGSTADTGTDTGATAALTVKGFYNERQVANALLQSNTFSSVTWLKTDVTPTANAGTNIDGRATGWLLTEGVAGTAALVQTPTITANSFYIMSVWLARGNTDWVRVRWLNNAGTDGGQAWFNLATMAVGTVGTVGAATNVTAGVAETRGPWVRVYVGATVDAASTTGSVQIMSASADNSGTRVNNATYFAASGQLEIADASILASARPSSNIETTTVAVTRQGDNATLPTSFWDAARKSEGSAYVELTAQSLFSNSNVFQVNAATNAGVMFIGSSGFFQCHDSVVFPSVAGVVPVATMSKCASRWNDPTTSDQQVVRAGVAGSAGALASTMGVGTVTGVGVGSNSTGGAQSAGYLRNLRIYRKSLTAAQLQAMTA